MGRITVAELQKANCFEGSPVESLSNIEPHFISFYALSIHVSIILLGIKPGLLEKRAKISSVAENPRFWMVDGDTGG